MSTSLTASSFSFTPSRWNAAAVGALAPAAVPVPVPVRTPPPRRISPGFAEWCIFFQLHVRSEIEACDCDTHDKPSQWCVCANCFLNVSAILTICPGFHSRCQLRRAEAGQGKSIRTSIPPSNDLDSHANVSSPNRKPSSRFTLLGPRPLLASWPSTPSTSSPRSAPSPREPSPPSRPSYRK